MTNVFVLQHVHEHSNGYEDTKLIGVYSTEEQAQAAIHRLINQPGFCQHPDGFSVDRYELDLDHWREGFGSPS
jgi:hypothetical protein